MNSQTLPDDITRAILHAGINLRDVHASIRAVIAEFFRDKVIIISDRRDIDRYTSNRLTEEQFLELAEQMEEELPNEDVVSAMAEAIIENEEEPLELLQTVSDES